MILEVELGSDQRCIQPKEGFVESAYRCLSLGYGGLEDKGMSGTVVGGH